MNASQHPERRKECAYNHREAAADSSEGTCCNYIDVACLTGNAATAQHHQKQRRRYYMWISVQSGDAGRLRFVLEAIRDTSETQSGDRDQQGDVGTVTATTLRIFTDSQATVRACPTRMKANANVRAIFHLAMELGRRKKNPLQVPVEWVPGHAGTAGNKANHRAAVRKLSCSDP